MTELNELYWIDAADRRNWTLVRGIRSLGRVSCVRPFSAYTVFVRRQQGEPMEYVAQVGTLEEAQGLLMTIAGSTHYD
jgi:hypothetical protein